MNNRATPVINHGNSHNNFDSSGSVYLLKKIKSESIRSVKSKHCIKSSSVETKKILQVIKGMSICS